MSNLNVVIIEDEIPAARLLHSMIRRIRPEWEVTVLPGNVEDAVRWFQENEHPDIIFLDIQLSDGNSFEFLTQAKPQSVIIFTTAYDEYAVRAFSVNSIDYILKPVDEQRLVEAIVKYENLISRKNSRSPEYLEVLLESLQRKEKSYRTRFLISATDKFRTLQVADIAYFYSENKMTYAVTTSGRENVVDFSLTRLSEQLDPDRFFRVNRQVLLSIDSILSVEPYFNNKIVVQVKPLYKGKILISEDKIQSFKMWLNY